MERHTYTINFWVSPSKARKNGKAPINITITLNGQRASFSSNKMIAPNDWDATRQRVKGTNETAKLINESLLLIKNQDIQEGSRAIGKRLHPDSRLIEGCLPK